MVNLMAAAASVFWLRSLESKKVSPALSRGDPARNYPGFNLGLDRSWTRFGEISKW